MKGNVTEWCKQRLCCLFAGNPRRTISIAWITSMVFVVVAFIVACISAAQDPGNYTSQNKSFELAAIFASIWTVILLLFTSIIGTVIMRRYQGAMAIGFLIGAIFILSQQMLILFTIFAEHVINLPDSEANDTAAQKAFAVFSFFLFCVYASFGSLLAVFRHDIIKEVPEEINESHIEDVPLED